MHWGPLVLVGLALGACTPDHPPQAIVPRPVYSEFGIDVSPYAYGNPSPYGYANAWGQPTGAANGYLGANRFSPRQGLMCERSRNVCYDQNGISEAETTKYLGSRDAWNRQRVYGSARVYIPPPQ